MKNKFLLSILTIFLCFLNLHSQQAQKESDNIEIVSIRRTGNNNQRPIPNGTTLNYYTPAISQNFSYQLNFSEYINGEKQEDDLSEIMFFKLVAGGKVKRFQIVPDVSRDNHFILFSFIPTGTMAFNHRFSKKNVKFEYLTFQTNEKQSFDTEVPLLIVFEGKADLDSALDSLKRKATDTLSELDFRKLISPEFPVKRVSVLYYVLKKQ